MQTYLETRESTRSLTLQPNNNALSCRDARVVYICMKCMSINHRRIPKDPESLSCGNWLRQNELKNTTVKPH